MLYHWQSFPIPFSITKLLNPTQFCFYGVSSQSCISTISVNGDENSGKLIKRSQTARPASGIEKFPNELLQKIFVLLPFQDMMQCSNACKQFFLNSLPFYPEAWTINTQLTSDRIFHFSSAPNSLIVYGHRRAELFEFTSCNRNLFKTGPRDGNKRIDYKNIFGSHLPNTRNVVCFKETVLYVFDMENVEKLAEIDVGEGILLIRCSTEAIAVVVTGENDNLRVLLYSWDGRRAELVRVFEDVRSSQISPNGVLAVTTNDGIELFNAHSRTDLGRIRIEAGSIHDNASLHLNVDGTMLAAHSDQGLLFFDTKTREPLSELAIPRQSHIQFSDDFRVFWQFTMLDEIILTTLDFYKERKISIAYTRHIPAHYEMCTVQFRRINGIQHLQFVTKENVLKLYRLDDIEKQWYSVE